MAGGQETGPGPEGDEPEVDALDTRVGSIVGKYAIVRMLGRGGMGAVYEARHSELSRRFAVKFLLPEFTSHRQLLARFEREAKAAGGLEHPNLVAVTDVGRAADGAPYLVMEFLQGEDCGRLLRRLGPLPVLRATDVVLQACRGLAVAHKAGIVHRDLKPENLFVTDAGDGSDRVKVLDFGIAQIRSPDRSRVTRTGDTLGTAHYMSPEQAHGDIDLDSRTDVWSLGVVLYELLSGRKPFEGERFLQIVHQVLNATPPSLAALRTGLPPDLVALVERAMTKNVTERLPTIAALADGLAPLAGRVSVSSHHELSAAAPTRATPATVVPKGTATTEAGKTGMTSTKSGTAPAAEPARSTATPWVVAGLVVAAVVATGALASHSKMDVRLAPDAGQVATPASAQPQLAIPIRLAGAEAPVTSAPPEPSAAPPGADGGAQVMFEPSEHGSNKQGRPPFGARTPIRPPALVPIPSAQSAASSEGPSPEATHHTKIDRANPY